MEDYIIQRDKVLDYIDKNLCRDMTLDELAAVSCYSKYHFSRIFSNIMGETVFHYIQRLRLEKAAEWISIDENTSITTIAYDLGFSNCSNFTRSFKNYFGLSPTSWKEKNFSKKKINYQDLTDDPTHNGGDNRKFFFNDKDFTWQYKIQNKIHVVATIQDVKDIPVIYVRHIGTSLGNSERFEYSYNTLIQWAAPRSLISNTNTYAIYHDNPLITDNYHLRISAAIEAPYDIQVSGNVGKMIIPGGKYAIFNFQSEGKEEYRTVFNFIYEKWLNRFGYKTDLRRYYYICFLTSPRDKVLKVRLSVPIIFM